MELQRRSGRFPLGPNVRAKGKIDLRVLMAHNRYRISGGEETHISLLERGLVELGVEVRRFERNSAELKESTAKRVATGLSLAYRPGGGGIRSALADWRPDVVHFHNLWPLLTPSALNRAAERSRGCLDHA